MYVEGFAGAPCQRPAVPGLHGSGLKVWRGQIPHKESDLY